MSGEYYKTRDSVEEYINLAKDVNGSKLIEKLKQYLPENSTLLEIGSGPGSDWNILNQSYDITGSDFSKEFLNYLISNNPEGKFLQLDAITLNVKRKFNGIYSNKVLIHLSNEELVDSINRQYEILDSQGIICHSFWKGEGSEIFKGLLVNYQSEEKLKRLFGEKFEILLLSCYKEFDEGDSLLLIGRKINL